VPARAWLADTLAGQRSLLLVDTNEQAARLSAELRAELVRLGRVQEAGVSLGLDGTTAGVGDVVQARRNEWELAGVEGNRRGPINRETYRVTAVREDASLEVTPTTTPTGTVAGMVAERIVLPADYVAADLALGYATTVHAAQGATVDTAHTVVTGRTGPAALYVGMSRGRESNTAHVTTVSVVEDAADGREDQTIHRDPIAALSGLLNPDEARGSKSALATAAESSTETEAVRTPAELLADASQLAATDRTATWLDELIADGTLSFVERARIVAEDGAASLTRVLRRAELAGRDARQTLVDAVAGRPLSGARNVTNVVVYSRISERDRFDPEGKSWADWTPTVTDPEWQAYLDRLAAAADQRTADLGAHAADEQSAWAVDTFGPVPSDEAERGTWQSKVGSVAAYRELRGHDSDDPANVLGPAPAPGQTEAFAAHRAAYRALGRPDTDREEMELSTGQLHIRIRAAAREEAWGPRYVGNELAGTRQAAASQHQIVALRTAEASAATDPADRGRLEQEAADAAALAAVLDEQTARLQELDDARAVWLAHTAMTRAKGERSKAELAIRHADAEPEPQVTAEEWLAADRASREEEDAYRDITEPDLHEEDHDGRLDEAAEVTHSDQAAEDVDRAVGAVVEPDVREIAADEPAQVEEDVVRVPSVPETTEALTGARRALAEVNARQILDDTADTDDERATELTRWHADDMGAEQSADDYADA
jgi:hypothetical protein